MKIMIGADLVPTPDSEKYFINKDITALFGKVKDLPKTVDRFMVNLECALTKSENAIKKFGPNLKADPLCADTIKAFGVTDVLLANNHVFDYGIEGLRDTMANLERVGIPYTGVGENDQLSRKPYVIEKDGIKVGFINVCEHEYTYALENRLGANPFDPFITMQDIRALKPQVDHVIILYHGGKEYCKYPSPRLRNLCREMVLCGADVVLTQHSHCLGCYEEFEGGKILYGQGNFHFCMEKERGEGWRTAFIVELDITNKIDIKFIPIVSGNFGIDVATGDVEKDIMDKFYARNEELKNGKWRDGWKAFCESKRGDYTYILSGLFLEDTDPKRNELFAHYLDCEAHTDVWRELFPTWNHTNK